MGGSTVVRWWICMKQYLNIFENFSMARVSTEKVHNKKLQVIYALSHIF